LRLGPSAAIHCTIKLGKRPAFIGIGVAFSPTPISGAAVLEYGATEILPPVGAILKHPARLCRPGRQPSRAQPRGKPGFSTLESSSGRETDSPLEGDGFELQVPRQIGNALLIGDESDAMLFKADDDNGFGRDTDSPVEGGGFEPSVPLAAHAMALRWTEKCRTRFPSAACLALPVPSVASI
jgi:hypothetical protein